MVFVIFIKFFGYGFCFRHWGKSNNGFACRYFAGNFKRNASAVCRNFNGLGDGHGGSIA